MTYHGAAAAIGRATIGGTGCRDQGAKERFVRWGCTTIAWVAQ
jgi:hypothetical protein